jgi:hypothetical protein
MAIDRKPQHERQEFAEKLRHLQEENRHLREASCSFGQLAERLSATLQQEVRKTQSNLLRWQRMKNDRRFSTLRLPADRSNDH